jgi:hypothetical protein
MPSPASSSGCFAQQALSRCGSTTCATAATLALSAGVPAKVVSEQLGHATSAFTLDVYCHVLPHMQAEAADRVAALLGMAEERENLARRRKPPQSVRSEAQQFMNAEAI